MSFYFYHKAPERFHVQLGVILSLLLILSGCSQDPEEGQKGPKRELILPVELGKAVFKSVVDEVRAVGNIVADQRVMITSEVRGKVMDFPVKEGQRLNGGDLIAQVDPRQYQLEVGRLQADLVSAQKEHEKAKRGARPEEQARLKAQVTARASALKLAKKEEKRFRDLVKEGVIAQSQYDTAYDRVLQAEEGLRSSEASLAAGTQGRKEDIVKMAAELESMTKRLGLAELNLEKSSLRAPFDGVILTRQVEVGAYIKDGDAVAEMIGASALKAVMELPQAYRGRLPELKEIEFFVPELNLRFKEKGNLKSRIRIIPDANIFSGGIQAQVELAQPNAQLFPGVTLEATLRFSVRKNVKHVPSLSLVLSEQGTAIYLAKEGKAHLVPVKAGLERGGLVEVTDFTHQLKPDSALILRGSGAVFPGAKIMPTNPPAGTGPPGGGPPGSKGPPGGKPKPGEGKPPSKQPEGKKPKPPVPSPTK